jgi:hypothetical protein
MTPWLRKFALTAHVASSVGWLGAVAGSLALAVAGLTSRDPQVVRAAYLTLKLTGWVVLVPLSLASLLTGLVQSLGTRWGLFRHYWILAKLLMNVLATIVLLLYMQTLSYLAVVAADTKFSSGDVLRLRNPSAVAHAVAALLLLLVATTLSVYKPQGMTRYGQRRQHEQRGLSAAVDASASCSALTEQTLWLAVAPRTAAIARVFGRSSPSSLTMVSRRTTPWTRAERANPRISAQRISQVIEPARSRA